MVPWWLYRTAPYMVNIQWLYQKAEPREPGLRKLREDLCQLLKERFLQLVDATYIYLIDQSPGAKSEEGAGEVSGNCSPLNIVHC
jgi:hypothetical protein